MTSANNSKQSPATGQAPISKSVRVPPTTRSLLGWIAEKQKRAEKPTTVQQECTILGAFLMAASLLPDPDGTYGEYTATELANFLLPHVRSAVDFCELNDREVRPLSKGVQSLLDSQTQVQTALLVKLAELQMAYPSGVTSNDHAPTRRNPIERDETDSLHISTLSIDGSGEVASAFGSDEGGTL